MVEGAQKVITRIVQLKEAFSKEGRRRGKPAPRHYAGGVLTFPRTMLKDAVVPVFTFNVGIKVLTR